METTQPVAAGEQCLVLIVEDDAMARRWIHEVLEATRFLIAGEASTVEQGLSMIARRSFDLLVVDHHLGESTGLDLLRQLRQQGVTTPAIVTTASAAVGLNEHVREAGGQGCLVKTGHADDLVSALERTLAGGHSFDPRNKPRVIPKLTHREIEVLREVAQGYTNQEIAERLAVSVNTVKTLQSHAGRKLGTHRRTATVVEARNLGLI